MSETRASNADEPDSAESPSQADERLAIALGEFESAMRQGSFADRERLLEKYGDIADLLEPCLDGLSFLCKVTANSPKMPLDSGNLLQLDDFVIVRELGRGGMGIVYEAKQESLQRRVALKIIPLAAIAGERLLNRFENEVQAAAMLDHRNIVSVYSVGSDKGVHYYAMQLVEGANLAEVIEEIKGTLSVSNNPERQLSSYISDLVQCYRQQTNGSRIQYAKAIAKIGIEAAEALHYAHQEGIVHRDIKPANLLIDESGTVFISDFGLARIESHLTLTMTGDVMGTLRYMSPEQARGKKQVIDHRTDVYSLGVTLYELLALRVPFDGESREEVFQQVTMLDAPPLHRIQSGIPDELATVIHKAIEKVPGERYDTAASFADDLQRFVEGRPVQAKPMGWGKRLWFRVQRNPKVAVAAGMAMIALATALVLMFRLSAANVRATVERHHALQATYASDMRAVDAAIQVGKPDQAREILEKYGKQQEDATDLRGFEWHCLWRMLDSERTAFCGHRAEVRSIAISPDESLLVTGGWDETLRFWDAKSGRLRATQDEPEYRVDCLDFLNNGGWLVTGDTALRVWDVASRKEIVRLEQEQLGQETVLRLALSEDESILATGGTHSIRIWQVDKKEGRPQLRAIEPDPYREVIHGQFIRSVALSPDGNTLAYSSSVHPQFVLWDVQAEKEIATIDKSAGGHTDQVTSLVFSPDGRYLASASWDKTIKLWSTDDWRCKTTMNGHHDVIRQIRFMPDGTTLLSGGRDRNLNLWDVPTGTLSASLPGHGADILAISVADSGKFVATGGRRSPLSAQPTSQEGGGVVKLWDVLERQELAPERPPSERATVSFNFPGTNISSMDVSSHGNNVLVGLDSGEVYLGNIMNESVERLATFDEPVYAVCFTPNEQQFAVATTENLTLCDAASGDVASVTQVLKSLSDREHLGLVEPSEDGAHLIAATNYGRLYSWDQRSGSLCQELASSPRGKRCGPMTLSAQQFSLIDNKALIRRPLFAGSKPRNLTCNADVTAFAESTSGSLFAMGHDKGTIRLFDGLSGKTLHELRGHLEEVSAITFTEDARRVATGSHDSTVRIWDTLSGLHLLTLRNLEGRATHLAFDKHASCLAVATRIAYRNTSSRVTIWKTAIANPER